MNNRLLIYSLYDKDGIVDIYVEYILNKIKPFVQEIAVIVNGKLSISGREKLEQITPQKNIIVRENKGFDIWGYKVGMDSYGWDKLSNFDEIILMNDTIFGPIDSFNEMFEVMEKKNVDFWGITAGNRVNHDPYGMIKYGYIPKHIQSYFTVIRKHMFQSNEFQIYWNNLPKLNNYHEAVAKHECIFTKIFSDYGFSWAVYIDGEEIETYVPNPLIHAPLKLIKKYKCPIFKRKVFNIDYRFFLMYSNGEETVELIKYLKDETSYDIDMIYEHILRISNQFDIKNCMHNNIILSNEITRFTYNQVKDKPKVALMLHLYFEDLFEETLSYAKNMPEYADIYISTQTLEKKKKIEKLVQDFPNKVTVIVINNRGRDVSALTVGFREYILNYDLICFTHDKKVSQLHDAIKGRAYAYVCYENTLGSKAFIENAIEKFYNDRRLGLLVPPPPQFAEYYPVLSGYGSGWGVNFDLCISLAKRLNINLDMDPNKGPIAPYGSIFWFRVDALKPLFDLNLDYKDFPDEPLPVDGTISHAIERIHPYIAQSRGYYSALTFSEKYARIQLTNLQFMLSELNKRIFNIFPPNYFEVELRELENISVTIENLKKENNILANRIIELSNEYKTEMDKILHSKSWKVTKPLRWIMGKLKRNI